MRQCQLENITLHYEVFGQGIPIIFLHGWTIDHRYEVGSFEPIFERRGGWQRIYLDLPGHGQTPGVDSITNQDQMLEVVLEFIEHLIPGKRFLLSGTSAGAYLAQGVVYRKSALVDGLLLRIPMIVAEDAKRTLPSPEVLVEDPDFMSTLSPEEKEFYGDMLIQKQSHFEKLKKLMEADIFPAQELVDEKFLALIRENPENYGFSFDVDNLPEPFRAPTLIMTGRQDTAVGYRDAWRIIDQYPRATFAVLDRAGHGLLVGKRDLFNALVEEWLDRVEEYIQESGDH